MKKPIIAVDIDDVLFPYVVELAKHYNAVNGTTLTVDSFHTYHFMEVFGCSEDESTVYSNAVHESEYLSLEPMRDAQAALTELAKRYELHIVTSRPLVFEEKTKTWLDRHFPGIFTRVDLVGNHYDGTAVRNKVDVCLEVGSKYLIDDQPRYVLESAEKGLQTVLFGDYGWNRAADLPANVTRCKDWDAVLEYFDGRDG